MTKEQKQQYATLFKAYVSNKEEAITLINSLKDSADFQEYLKCKAIVSLSNTVQLHANITNFVCIAKDVTTLEVLINNGAYINEEICGRTPLACILRYNSSNPEATVQCLNLLLNDDIIDLDAPVQKIGYDTYQIVVPNDFEGIERVVKYIQHNAMTWCIMNFETNQEVFAILVDAYHEKHKLTDVICLPYVSSYLQEATKTIPIYTLTNGTYLDCAIYNNKLPVVQKLLELGCNPTFVNPELGIQYYPLQWAIDPYVTLNSQIIDALLKKGAKVFVQCDKEGEYYDIGIVNLITLIYKNAQTIKAAHKDAEYTQSLILLKEAFTQQGAQTNIDVSQLQSQCEAALKLLGNDGDEMPLIDATV